MALSRVDVSDVARVLPSAHIGPFIRAARDRRRAVLIESPSVQPQRGRRTSHTVRRQQRFSGAFSTQSALHVAHDAPRRWVRSVQRLASPGADVVK